MKSLCYILLFVFTFLSCSQKLSSLKDSELGSKSNTTYTPYNIIFMMGDGMGPNQVSAIVYTDTEKIAFERFPYTGLLKTSSSSHKITDSAAGATVYSSGFKTYNGAIGVDRDTIAQETILEELHKKGYATGVIATSTITHATPASYYAHVDSRSKQDEIAEFLLQGNVDVFAGGGLQHFNKRKDGRDLIPELQNKGYIIDTMKVPSKLNPDKKYGILLADDGMPRMLDGRGDFLPAVTQKTLDYMDAKNKPFFMLVEGSQIDWGGHANDAEYVVTELVDFNDAINVALDYAEKKGNTIVIVTADHECGGFTLPSKSVFGKSDYDIIEYQFTSGGHSGAMVPIFAFGPGADNFSGMYENDRVYHILKNILNNK